MNRLSTVGFVLPSVHVEFRLFVFCEEKFRRRFLDALEGTKKDSPLGGQFCWHSILPDPSPQPRRAPQRELPVLCLGFVFGGF